MTARPGRHRSPPSRWPTTVIGSAAAAPTVSSLAPANVVSVPLDADLARRLTQAGRKTEDWRTRRDELIREAAKQGATLREIAAAGGLSNPGVLRVIRRGELEVHHVRAQPEGGGEDPNNTVFLTPEEHARRDRLDPES